MPNHDLQTLLVYDAEDAASRPPIYLSRQDMSNFLNVVLSDPLWSRKYGKRKLGLVIQTPKAKNAYAWVGNRGKPYMAIGSTARQRDVHIILHEVAHLLCPRSEKHGERFCNTLLYLTKKYSGTYWEKKLYKRYRQTRAMTRARRPIR